MISASERPRPTAPIDGATRVLWQECADVGMPRAVVDHAHRPTARRFRRRGGELPTGVRRRGASALPADGRRCRRRSDRVDRPALADRLRPERRRIPGPPTRPNNSASPDPRDDLIEAVITESEDDGLLDRYLAARRSASTPSSTTWRPPWPAARSIRCWPCVPTTGTRRSGTARGDLPVLPDAGRARSARRSTPRPAPSREPLSGSPTGPLVAEVVKTTTDPYVGRVSRRPGVLRAPCCPTSRCTSAGTSPGSPVIRRTRTGMPNTIWTNGPGAISRPVGCDAERHCAGRGRRHRRRGQA